MIVILPKKFNHSNPSPLQPSEYYSSPLSPLKRQMSQVSINPDSSAKKKLLVEDSEIREEGSSSNK
ncbi:hypothetical protein Leryth_018776 [Lithospermum erythrorhizon]|nr:hypothetical protein Leryth_018776 [Lithospermum erythrorhizon]